MATESYEKLITDLKKLRLPAMAEMLDSYTKQAASSSMSYMDFLSNLVMEEVRYKERRGVENRIKSARFPVMKSLDDFDYAFQPSINRIGLWTKWLLLDCVMSIRKQVKSGEKPDITSLSVTPCLYSGVSWLS